MTSEEIEKICKQMDSKLGPLDKVLANYEGAKGKWGNAKYKYRNRQFWCRGYYADTAGKNERMITEYIRNQLKNDELSEQLTLNFEDPFTGSRR